MRTSSTISLNTTIIIIIIIIITQLFVYRATCFNLN